MYLQTCEKSVRSITTLAPTYPVRLNVELLGSDLAAPSDTKTKQATLADLESFSKTFINQVITNGTKLDCADLAIELWIRFGAQYGVPVSFYIWDNSTRKHAIVRDRDFSSTSSFLQYVQNNLGARGLICNTEHVPGGYRAAIPGDVYLWEFYDPKTATIHKWGHTQIFYQVVRRKGHRLRIKVAQGSLDKDGKATLVEFKDKLMKELADSKLVCVL